MDSVTCPNCQSPLDVSSFAPGTQLTCGSCGGLLEVPFAEPPPVAPARGAASRSRARGSEGRGGGRREQVPDLLIPAILVAIFCCQIGGIVAIVYAAQANAARDAGRYESAVRSAASAKTWLILSLVVGPLLMIAFGLITLLGGSF